MKELVALPPKNYCKPKAAYKKLKTAKQTHKNIYIRAMLGFGKTALIQHALKDEEYLYFSAKNGRFEPDIEDCPLTAPILVFDDLSFLTDEYGRVFVREQLRSSQHLVIMLGRSQLPKWLKLCYYESPFLFIEEEDLRLSDEELHAYLTKQSVKLPFEIIQQLNKRIHGYPVIATMLALHLKNGETYSDELHAEVVKDFNAYLDYELYQRWEPSIYQFVLQTSIVDSFNYKLAEMITGRNDVEVIIEQILDIGKFLTEEHGEFSMPPFLRMNLRERLSKEYTKQQRNDLYYNAGLYYEMYENISKALEMYKICENDNRILGILTRNVECNLNTGHLFELRHHYMNLAREDILKSIPLMAGMSMLYSLMLQPDESEHWYRCLKNFEKRQTNSRLKKEAQSRLAYLDVALPHRGSYKVKEILVCLGTNTFVCQSFL